MGRRALLEYSLATRKFLYLTLREAIINAFPDHYVSSDPNDLRRDSAITWIVQPLDGEMNFLRSLHNYCAVIGIYEGRTLQHSMVYDYLQDDEYYATREETAMVNQNRLRVSKVETLSDAVVACTEPIQLSLHDAATAPEIQAILGSAIKHIRTSGSPGLDLAQVARGRLDALITFSNPQDATLSSTTLLITEAGGFTRTVSRADGTQPIIVAANPRLNQTISNLLKPTLDSESHSISNPKTIGLQQAKN